MHVAALLHLDPADLPTVAEVRRLLGERVQRVPRLRQRLHGGRFGRGPYWIDDPSFDLDQQLLQVPGIAPTDERAALDAVMNLTCRPLSRDRPLWRAAVISDDRERVGFLALLMHHVLADGVAGLAALAALSDAGQEPVVWQPPAPQPSTRSAPKPWTAGLSELGLLGSGAPRLAPRISLTRPTGPDRRAAVTRTALPDVTALAHAAGGTVNDVLLTMITGALLRVLRARGEHPPWLVVSVPVAGPAGASATSGNHTGVRPVTVPAIADDPGRLRCIVGLTHRQRSSRRASSAAPLGFAFRLLARLGLFGWFVDHQRLVHTFASNLRGPAARLSIGRHPITQVTALSVTPGNIGVSFTALSYAGDLALTVVTDPTVCDPGPVAEAAEDCLARLLARR